MENSHNGGRMGVRSEYTTFSCLRTDTVPRSELWKQEKCYRDLETKSRHALSTSWVVAETYHS